MDHSRLQHGLVIVAHPDDETIWCGGLILARACWNWTVLCLCRADDPDRQPKFVRACRQLRAEGRISDLDDGNPLSDIDPWHEIGQRLARWTEAGQWDLILTHGSNGEYGHRRHIETHRVVADMVRGKQLCGQEVWTFAAVPNAQASACVPAPEADIQLPLTAGALGEKREIIQSIYGYGPDSFEVRSCFTPEHFNRLRT